MPSIFLLPISCLAALLVLSALFSGSETALFSLNKLQIKRLSEGGSGARLAYRLLHEPERLLIVILVGNTLVNIAISSIGARMASRVAGGVGVTVSVWLTAFLLLIFGDIIPKFLAYRANERLSQIISWPIFVFGAAIYPIRLSLRLLSTWIVMLLGAKPERPHHKITREDLQRMVIASQKQGAIERDEGKIMENIFSLQHRSLREVMIPRVDMEYLTPDQTLDEILEFSRRRGRLRIPVYDVAEDEITGIIFVKDLIVQAYNNAESKERLRARDLMRTPLIVPEGTRIDDLLQRFRSSRIHAAVAVDDFGAHSGWAVMEDLLDEVAGELDEEYEKKEFDIAQLGQDRWRVPGRLPIRKFNDLFSARLPEGETFHTLAGFVMMRLAKRLPAQGETFRFRDWNFKVLSRDETRLAQLEVFRTPAAEAVST